MSSTHRSDLARDLQAATGWPYQRCLNLVLRAEREQQLPDVWVTADRANLIASLLQLGTEGDGQAEVEQTRHLQRVAEKLQVLKAAVPSLPNHYLFSLPPGLPLDAPGPDMPLRLRRVLELSNGPGGVEVGLYSTKYLDERQSDCEEYDGCPEAFRGGPEKWVVIGWADAAAGAPLLMDRRTGVVWWFPDGAGGEWWNTDRFEPLAGLEEFMADYFLGDRYRLLCDGDGDWWQLLRSQGLAST